MEKQEPSVRGMWEGFLRNRKEVSKGYTKEGYRWSEELEGGRGGTPGLIFCATQAASWGEVAHLTQQS